MRTYRRPVMELLDDEQVECPRCDRTLRRVGTPLNGFWECPCGFYAAGL